MTGIDEKGMVIPQKEGVYLSSQTAGSRDLFTYLLSVRSHEPALEPD